MNQALNKYGKARWGSIRLSRPSKRRAFLRKVQAAAAAMSGVARVRAISSTPAHTADQRVIKAMAIAQAVIEINIDILKAARDDRT